MYNSLKPELNILKDPRQKGHYDVELGSFKLVHIGVTRETKIVKQTGMASQTYSHQGVCIIKPMTLSRKFQLDKKHCKSFTMTFPMLIQRHIVIAMVSRGILLML